LIRKATSSTGVNSWLKVLMLRSIRMFHQKYIAHRHCCQKTALRIFHHLKMELAEVLLATILLGYMYNLCINVFWASRAPTDRVYKGDHGAILSFLNCLLSKIFCEEGSKQIFYI
jgi:hypothetical protein